LSVLAALQRFQRAAISIVRLPSVLDPARTDVENRNGTVTVSSMPTITLKNIPADLHRELKKRAEEHHRSLNQEVIAMLRRVTAAAIPIDAATLEESVRRARSLFRRPVTAREIDRWKRVGRL